MSLEFEMPAEISGWANDIGCAVTLCDCEGVILYMNEKARTTFAKHGDMIGQNLFPCHNPRSQAMIRHMLETGETNAYTIEKQGIHKLIYQTPWRHNGQIAGMAEISIPLPPNMPHYIRGAAESSVQSSMAEILHAESQAVSNIPITNDYDRAVEIIIDRVHKRGGKLVASGMGKAGQIAMNIATTFASTGTPAVNLHPSEAQHGDLGILQPNDALLLVSNSGKTREILELIDLARGLYADIPIILITGNPNSPVAEYADAVLSTGGAPEVCPFGLTPTTSTTMMTVIGDVLVVNTMRLTNFSREEYAKRHHGGYLGSIALKK